MSAQMRKRSPRFRRIGSRAVLVLFLQLSVLGLVVSPAQAAPGDIDTTFDVDGKVTTDFNGGFTDAANAVAVQPDGKIVVAGFGAKPAADPGDDFIVARYNANGSLDTTFDTDGKVTTDFGAIDEANALALQADGKIVVAGSSSANEDMALARYNANGSLDTTFDADGKVMMDLAGGAATTGDAVVVQTDGKIVVAGEVDLQDTNFVVGRFNTNGTPDTGFDTDGAVATDFGGLDSATDIALQADGKIVVSGVTIGALADLAINHNFVVARYSANGALDATFDADGRVTTDFGAFDEANAIALQSDGKAVVVGGSFASAGNVNGNFAAARYNTNGSPDTTFDTDGRVTTDIGAGTDDDAGDLALQADGRIVLVGGNGVDFAVVRYNTNGGLDTSFDTDGKVTTDFGGTDRANAVALQSDGRLVAVGDTVTSGSDFALARYMTSSGSLYNPLVPDRVLDTRVPTGTCIPGPCGPVSTNTPMTVQIAGQGGVPASGVTAVIMNVAVTGPTQSSHVKVWPADAPEPNASNLNFVAGQTVPNLVTVKLSAAGTVKMSVAFGITHLVADVAGWYGEVAGARFTALTPDRTLDTRTPVGLCSPSPCAPVSTNTPMTVQIAGRAGVPASGVSAVVMNVAVTGPTQDSHVKVWPADAPEPNASNLNFVAGQTVPNLVIVKLSAAGTVNMSVAFGTTHLVADVFGWYSAPAAPTGARFTAVTPNRTLDTRTPFGVCTPSPCGAVSGNTPMTVQITGRAGVPASGVSAVVMNVAVTGPTQDSHVKVWPADAPEPNASNLNFVAGQTVPNLVIVKLSPAGTVKMSVAFGTTHLVADVAGWFNTE